MPRRAIVAAGMTLALTAGLLAARAAEKQRGRLILDRVGIDGGICVALGDPEARLAIELARYRGLTVYVPLADAQDAETASRAADAAGLFGTRVFVAKSVRGQIGLADNIADAVIAPDGLQGVPRAEVLRVLRPGGKAVVGSRELTKPFPKGVDDWTHHYHGPDNNPQSGDQLATAPYLTQFIAEPRYASAPQAAVSSAGRVFMAFGHVAWHEREEAVLNTLIAVNGFNGTLLWKRGLTPGIMVDRNTMIATPDTLYLGDKESCKLIDTATGRMTDEIAVPAELTDGPFWKWMALEGGVLYALVGKDEPADPTAQWRAVRHGWPWNGISEGYNSSEYTWGLGKTLVAIDPESKRVLWHQREAEPIDSRAMCMKNGRIYYACFGRYIACADAKTGEVIWRRTAETDPDVFEAIGPYRPGHGYVGGWKSTVYAKCTDEALYFVGPQVEWLTALSAEDGHVLWKFPVKDLHIVIRDDGLYTIGAQNSEGHTKKLDPLTGNILAEYGTHRRACTRSVGGPDGILFRASGGSVRLDLPSGKPQWISPMRPSCHIGVLIANGHLYFVPWVCDCNLQMFGVISCGPAGDFDLQQKATTGERLEIPEGDAGEVAALDESAGDWPTYRADNTRSGRTSVAIRDEVNLVWQADPEVEFEPTAPVAAGGLVLLGGSDGIVRALDGASGKPRWRAYTGGAVMYPPSIAEGRAFVGSGDGWAYSLEAATGRTLWRFRAAPSERRIPVYGALLSTWPVGSGVLVEDGLAYFAAGITDYDGTHLYALDAGTGEAKWQNNTAGHLDAFSKRGAACQGELLLHDGKLYLAGGNAVSPAVFDAAGGTCLNQAPAWVGTQAPRGRELRLEGSTVHTSGQPLYSTPDYVVYDKSAEWTEAVVSTANAALSFRQAESGDRDAWSLVARNQAGDTEMWTQPLPAEPVRWGLAVDAEGRVIVALRGGQVLCFG
jgi:outer membrane protein assembly factor BamB